MAGRAHQTLRFELLEQSKVLPITDQDVLNEYFSETGGEDTGLVVSRSLRTWRRRGWIAAGKRYFAKAYARVNERALADVRAAIYADVGVGIGFTVTQSAMDQFDRGEPWDVVRDSLGRIYDADVLGGHYVYLPAYHADGGFTCVTWGKRQKMTAAFFKHFVDEAWAIWDANNTSAKMNQIFDMAKLDEFLGRLNKNE